jgi:putative transcriptional regulator
MTITHHPPEALLAGFATGALDEAEHLVVGVHIAGCPQCSRFVQAIEQLAGKSLEDVPPMAMSANALDRVMSGIHKPRPAGAARPVTERAALGGQDLPELLRSCRFGKQRLVAPGISMQPITLSGSAGSRAFLLQSAPGTRMLEHSHTGTELTCVLKGSFSHDGGHYGPGDFDYGDNEVDHRPVVGAEEPCLCLVAMTGNLRMNGLLGRLIGPFVRL